MRYLASFNIHRLLLASILLVAPLWTVAQQSARLLSVDELFRLGTENSLQLKKTKMQEAISNEREKSARINLLPDIQVLSPIHI